MSLLEKVLTTVADELNKPVPDASDDAEPIPVEDAEMESSPILESGDLYPEAMAQPVVEPTEGETTAWEKMERKWTRLQQQARLHQKALEELTMVFQALLHNLGSATAEAILRKAMSRLLESAKLSA